MISRRWNGCAWWVSKSLSSMKLLLFMVPLMLVAVLVFVLGPSVHSWDFIGKRWSSISASSSSSSSLLASDGGVVTNMEANVLFDERNREGLQDLRSGVVVDVDALSKEEEKAISDDIAVNQYQYPPPSVQDIQRLEQSNETEEILNVPKPWPNTAPENESNVPHPRQKQQRNFSILDRTEAGLQQARAAIREARNKNQTQDPDFVPIGPMYWNDKAFHRSYLEMEKRFRVFIYKEGEPPVFHNGYCQSIYSMEGNFMHAIEMNDQFRTMDPEKAHIFFLPFSVVMLVKYVYVEDSHDFGPLRKTVTDYVNFIAGRYSYWNRSLGADHFMLACHDWGPEISFSIPNMHKNSIRVLCNANTSEGFNPAKDVSFPEINLPIGSINGLISGPSTSRRPVLAFFAGGLHGPIRPALFEHWENKDEDIQVHKYLPKGVSYYKMLRKSKFCLCPSGYEVASPRVVEAIYTGCVPVLISEHYVPPFSDVLNWKSFSLEVSMKDIPKLKQILTRISPRQFIRMQKRVGQIRRHFEVHSPPKRFDVFHMILHSIWLRRLNFRLHDDR